MAKKWLGPGVLKVGKDSKTGKSIMVKPGEEFDENKLDSKVLNEYVEKGMVEGKKVPDKKAQGAK